MSSSRESGFRVMSWSFRTEGLLGPRPGWSSRRGSLLGDAEAVGPQEDVLQLCVEVGNGSEVIAERADDVDERCRQFGHGPVELVRDRVTQIAAKVELMFRNHACGESAY
jgi:hypothetical protein